jgi:hypothetical protein
MKTAVFVTLVALSVYHSSAQSGFDLASIERGRVIALADSFLALDPITITSSTSSRSAGGLHDFFSEGDYWWPDPKNPDGPYVQRDGMTNPDNFVDHRKAMIRFSIHVGALTSAYKITGDTRYALKAVEHLRAWFVADATRMNPSLLYAQAIKGKATGRGTGIIDTIQLIEVARAAQILIARHVISEQDAAAILQWFRDYLTWLRTHKYGLEERDAKNNHGTCWVMQVAAFALLVGDTSVMNDCRNRYREILLPTQMAADGSFPLELKRTKPFGYSIFNLDAFATICRILSNDQNDLWHYETPDGRGMRKGMEFLYPYLLDKTRWPFAKDVLHWDDWPVRQPSLLFAGLSLSESRYLDLWSRLEATPTDPEVIRNLPIRFPLLWIE